MSTQSEPAPALAPSARIRPTSETALSVDELQRLTLFKWRYSLQARGFPEREVEQLMFLKWRWATAKLS